MADHDPTMDTGDSFCWFDRLSDEQKDAVLEHMLECIAARNSKLLDVRDDNNLIAEIVHSGAPHAANIFVRHAQQGNGADLVPALRKCLAQRAGGPPITVGTLIHAAHKCGANLEPWSRLALDAQRKGDTPEVRIAANAPEPKLARGRESAGEAPIPTDPPWEESFVTEPEVASPPQKPNDGGQRPFLPLLEVDGELVFADVIEAEWSGRSRCLPVALVYATVVDWAVFPAPPGTKKSYKSAKFSDGARWGATRDPQQIQKDFTRWPDANVAIPTGKDNGFWVLETDTKAGHANLKGDGRASLQALIKQHGPLPETLQAVSPSGSKHFYFEHPEGITIRNSVSQLAPGIDIRGEGGMVIAPPSIRDGVGAYRWVTNVAPAKTPAWLLQLIQDGAATKDDRPRGVDEQRLAELPFTPIKEGCPWLRHVHDTGGGDQSEILWRHSLRCCIFLKNGEKLIHEFSNKHDDYEFEATEEKYNQAYKYKVEKDLGYPQCQTIHNDGGEQCKSCPHLAAGGSPLNLALQVPADNFKPSDACEPVNRDAFELAEFDAAWVTRIFEGDTDGSYRNDQSQLAFAVACELVRSGLDNKFIARVLLTTQCGAYVQESPSYRLNRTIHRAHEFVVDPDLERMNSQHAVLPIGGKTRVVTWGDDPDFPGRKTIVRAQTFDDFKNLHSNKRKRIKTSNDGKQVTKYTPLGHWWLGQKHRRQFDGGQRFMPQHEAEVVGNVLNMFEGFPIQPRKPNGGSGASGCQLFLDHGRKIICSGDEEHWDYLLKRESLSENIRRDYKVFGA